MQLIEKSKKTNNRTLWNIYKKIGNLLGIYSPSDYIVVGRKVAKSHGLRKLFYEISYMRLGTILRLEIPSSSYEHIGKNFQLIHASSVVIHEDAIIGDSCTVYKGVSIGSVRSGKRAGVPILQDRVVVHANSVIAGGITIGHDSLIAANSFVDFDVPPHSVVIGNPATIHHKENASKDYIKM